jgi:penicillin-binding protein 1C
MLRRATSGARTLGKQHPVVASVVLGALAFVGVATLDVLFPPDLSRFEDRSISVLDRQGGMLRPFLSSDDKWRFLTRPVDVEARYVDLLKAYEDQRFDDHWGIDTRAAARALGQLLGTGEVVSGASTLTMQAARLLEPGPRSIGGKAKQAVRALQLERRYTKDQILTIYLTLAPFGGNLEGVRSASLAYFGREPNRLTLAEAAMLVAIPQSPERRRPDRGHTAAKEARDFVLDQLFARGAVEMDELREAKQVSVLPARGAFPFVAPRLAQRLKGETNQDHIATTIHPDLQATLAKIIAWEDGWMEDGASLAGMIVDNKTRNVLAYAGGADFWGKAGQIDLARAMRSPGSALKPFIYGLAFDRLPLNPATFIEDRPTWFGDYAPRNFSRDFQGVVTVREALQWSLNVPAVALLEGVGPHRLWNSLQQAGVKLSAPRGANGPSLPLALGGVGASLEGLVTGYVAIARGGVAAPLRYKKDAAPGAPFRIMSDVAAWYVTDSLKGSPLPDGLGQAQGLSRGRAIAFKTGTSYGFRDAWAIGFSPTYTVGIWSGRPDGSTRPDRFGRNTAAPLLLKIFELLPTETEPPMARPPAAIQVENNARLPAPMQKFRRGASQAIVGMPNEKPLVIAFPPDGAVVRLAHSMGDEKSALALRASGGQAPLHWVVNGAFLELDGRDRRRALWKPDSEGFARITVLDAAGRSASSAIRLAAPD